MEFSAKQIASLLGGKVEGDENIVANKLCKIEQGEEKGLSFLANPKYNHYLYSTKSSIVIINESFVLEDKTNATLIRVKDAYSSFAKLLGIYNEYRFNRKGISSLAFIDKEAKVDEDSYVGEFAVIEKHSTIGKGSKIYPQVYIGENVHIGENVTIYAGVKIYHDTVIKDNCILHSGVVIGADGFGFAPLADGSFAKISQIGNVILEENVEIGANATVDRATMGSTVVGKGSKIDNLCQVAHNVTIGQSTVMASQTGISGSTQIGSNCFIGGQVGFAGHIKIGDRVQIGAQSGIMGNTKDDSKIMGYPAMNARDFMKCNVVFRQLPELEKRISLLEKQLKEKEK